MTRREPHLRGHVALITGSSRNLGAEIARAVASCGARVIVNYHSSRASADEVVAKLEGSGHAAIGGDVSTPQGVEELVAEAERLMRAKIDILVNNTGPFSMTPFVGLEPQEFDFIWNANVRSAYLTARRAAPGMAANGWGRIVNISAGSAFVRNHSVYSLAKDAMITLTEQLALELGPAVTVNGVAPGQIAESAEEMASFDTEFVPRIIARTPAGRLVTRTEVAGVVLALCSPAFDMVTGATVPVDGGARLPVA
ncbi:MAG TPA: SDR family oxidoreductase [Streptosporangiaceae bacterium]|nr:SDR family oxidoreductase [Streptosporangiaceae bacterium]